jgi:threonine/homoserine/homoserine lactone efflux protein
MPSVTLLIEFLVTTVTFAFLPGPAMLYTAGQTIARGRKAGLMAAFGIHCGGYAHVFAAAAGLAFLFHAVPPLYMTVKLAGAIYLIWLGLSMLRAERNGEPSNGAAPEGSHAFRQSVLVELLNPKTAIFFMSFLPQFVDPTAGFPVWLQFALLGVAVNLIFSIADVLVVFLAGLLVRRMGAGGLARRVARGAGGAMIAGLGFHLALQRA